MTKPSHIIHAPGGYYLEQVETIAFGLFGPYPSGTIWQIRDPNGKVCGAERCLFDAINTAIDRGTQEEDA